MKNVLFIILIISLVVVLIAFVGVLTINSNSLNIDSLRNLFNSSKNTSMVNAQTIEKDILNLNNFIFKDNSADLFYEGGPSHWGSRKIEYINIYKSDIFEKVYLNITDNSDLSGLNPPKQWIEKWETKNDGLYINDILMIKSSLKVGDEWSIQNYIPLYSTKNKYDAKIRIIEIKEENKKIENIITQIEIPDIKMLDNTIYTEKHKYKAGAGIMERSLYHPEIQDLEMRYWLWKEIKK